MLQKLNEHINQNFPFLKDKKLLIAISGGVDSVVLTHLLHQLQFDISLAHCNFQLRANESNLDEEFVQQIGKELNLKVFTTRFDTEKYAKEQKLSIQVSARKLRYNWFNKLTDEYKFDFVLTAHHADDNLETFLINLTRGTGLEGLTGIPTQNKNIVRPLLGFSREEILDYTKSNKIKWREDASNAATKYLRNKIRHEIVPKLKEINPNLLTSFRKTSEFLQQSQQIVTDKIHDISEEIISFEGDIVKLDIQKIQQLSNPKAYLYQILKKYGFTEWSDVFNLLNAQSGKYLETKSHKLLKNRDFLLVLPAEIELKEENNSVFYIHEDDIVQNRITIDVKKNTALTLFDKKAIVVNKKLVIFPLILRKWKEGDYFYPLGMKGRKKLSKYFKDEKLSLVDKKKVWLLSSNDNKIIWVVGMRQDRRFSQNDNENNNITISIE